MKIYRGNVSRSILVTVKGKVVGLVHSLYTNPHLRSEEDFNVLDVVIMTTEPLNVPTIVTEGTINVKVWAMKHGSVLQIKDTNPVPKPMKKS